MTKPSQWKYGLGALLLLAGGVVAYALYDSGRLPGVGSGAAREIGKAEEDVLWSPSHSDPAKVAQTRTEMQAKRELRRHTPWGIKPDEDDPNLTEEQSDALEKEFKARRKAFRELPKEQRQAIRKQCFEAVRKQPGFDCTTLWLK